MDKDVKETCCSEPCNSSRGIRADQKWLNWAFGLVIMTILYNCAEAFIAVLAGEKADSVALVGFGVDSLIEVSAAAMMLWRLLEQVRFQSDEAVERAERNVHRFVGLSFFLLAVYIVINSSLNLWHQEKADPSLIGIVLAGLSLLVMPLLSLGKMRVAKEINSSALMAEAKETIACSVLSLILLLGLAANAAFGWWWADSVAALLMLPWLLKEGIAGLKGEGCCG